MGIFIAVGKIVIDWVARLITRRASHPQPETPAKPTLPAHPAASRSRFGGRAWHVDAHGVHADGRLWRTPGEPITCEAILALHRDLIMAIGQKHGVDPALIVMTIATEAGAFRRDRFTGPRSFRWEKHVLNRDAAPPFRGSYSAGPMQVLDTTARDLVTTHGRRYGLAHAPSTIAPAYAKQPKPAPQNLPLYAPEVSIDLGAAVIRRGLALTGNDPILVAAAYNSGGLYESRANAWRLRSHGDHLDRAARWYGDACFVLARAGLR